MAHAKLNAKARALLEAILHPKPVQEPEPEGAISLKELSKHMDRSSVFNHVRMLGDKVEKLYVRRISNGKLRRQVYYRFK